MARKLEEYKNDRYSIFSATKRSEFPIMKAEAFFTPVKDFGATNDEDQLQWKP